MNLRRVLCFAVFVAFLSFTPSAIADSTMTLTGAGSNVMNGVYIGPYTATINGVSTPVICDDYFDDSYIPESWTASTSTFPGLTSVKFTGVNETQNYEEMAYLALELLAAPVNSVQAGEIQYALWGVSDPGAIPSLTAFNAADGAAAQGYLTGAQNSYSSLTAAQLAEFTFYTPNTNDPITCGSGACASTPPQEFITVTTPEPGTTALLAIGLGGLFLLTSKRRKQQLSASV
jgi:PEP-CTERM motif